MTTGVLEVLRDDGGRTRTREEDARTQAVGTVGLAWVFLHRGTSRSPPPGTRPAPERPCCRRAASAGSTRVTAPGKHRGAVTPGKGVQLCGRTLGSVWCRLRHR